VLFHCQSPDARIGTLPKFKVLRIDLEVGSLPDLAKRFKDASSVSGLSPAFRRWVQHFP
jgi:hypothetical protein